jgi:hypothetical protein
VRRKTGEPGNRGAGEPDNEVAGRWVDQRTGSPTLGNMKLKDCWGLWKLSEKELKIFQGIKRSWAEGDEEVKKIIGL